MPFRGPNRGVDVTALLTPYRLQREQEETDFERELRRAEMGNRASSIMGESIARDQAQQERTAAGRERLAMTPGVRSGSRPRGVPTVADELMRPESFSRYGQSYTFDPAMEAAGEGAAAGLRQTTAEQTRLQALRNIPGITPTMANRLVMGRTGMVDEEGEQSALRAALAEYVRAPSREGAASAIRAGAALNPFPDRYFLPEGEAEPRRGSPEYMAMRRAELEQQMEVQTQGVSAQAPIRARAAADWRAPSRARVSKVIGPNGEIGILNLDTEEVEWTGAMGARPGGAPSILEQYMTGTAPTSPTTAPAPASAPVAAPTAPTPAAATAASVSDSDIEESVKALRRLAARGVKDPTPEQLRAEVEKYRGRR